MNAVGLAAICLEGTGKENKELPPSRGLARGREPAQEAGKLAYCSATGEDTRQEVLEAAREKREYQGVTSRMSIEFSEAVTKEKRKKSPLKD